MTDFHPLSSSFGRQGSTYITDTDAHSGRFGIIQALASTVIESLTSATNENGDVIVAGTLTTVPLPAGVCIYGYFTDIRLQSGKVMAYNV